MEKTKARIFYTSLRDEDTAHEKRDWFGTTRFEDIAFENIHPDKNHNWVNLAEDSDWEELIPIWSKRETFEKIFELASNGINTARDEWVYGLSENLVRSKIEYFTETYNSVKNLDQRIKQSRDLKVKFARGWKIDQNEIAYVKANYRPFCKLHLAINKVIIDVISSNPAFFCGPNKAICWNQNGLDLRFYSTDIYPDWHLTGDTKCVPIYFYDSSGNRHDNITDWGLAQFRQRYCPEAAPSEGLGRLDIFHYVYAVLHNPAYRKKYELNLKREFPRIPFYEDFAKWAAWGKELMDLHIGYETVEPWPLELVTAETRPEMKKQKELFPVLAEPGALYGYQAKPKVKLKADKERGIIELDELSLLRGVPPEAWEYILGNRSALEWILDQYKEKKPTDPTIAEKFNTYRFADYKDKVIDLLRRVCRVSVETVRIVGEMGED